MNHLILIGFKGVGKSTVGRAVAKKLGRVFYDLDEEVEKQYAREYGALSDKGSVVNCHEIFERHGEEFFRELEYRTLGIFFGNYQQGAPKDSPENSFVLAVGGGVLLREENRALLEKLQSGGKVCIVHVTAPPKIVFERIMAQGRPAFFPDGLSDREAFEKLWSERLPLYKNMADITVEN